MPLFLLTGLPLQPHAADAASGGDAWFLLQGGQERLTCPCIWAIAVSAAVLWTNCTKPQPLPGGILVYMMSP